MNDVAAEIARLSVILADESIDEIEREGIANDLDALMTLQEIDLEWE
jgi:hypothetical protein